MTHKTLQLSALCCAVSLIASPAIAANTGFKTLTIGLPITTLQVVNDGLIRYDWRSDIDEVYRSSYHLTPASNRCLVYATLARTSFGINFRPFLNML